MNTWKHIASTLNRLNALSSYAKAQIEEYIHREHAYQTIIQYLKTTEAHQQALDYYQSSTWTLDQLSAYVQVTGELPSESMKWLPSETLQTLELARIFPQKACAR